MSAEYFYPKGYNLVIFNQEGISLNASQYQVFARANYVNDVEI